MSEPLLSILTQLPLVAACIWFVLELTKRQDDAQRRRDEQWRDFLGQQRDQSNETVDRLAAKTEALAAQVVAMNTALVALDRKINTTVADMRAIVARLHAARPADPDER